MRTLKLILVALLVLSLPLIGVHRLRAKAQDTKQSIVVDGLERFYFLHLPANYNASKPAPLVLALHGRLGTGEGQQRLSHFDKVSDEHGFLVAYPDGFERSWADGRGGTPADKKGLNDVKFLSQLIGTLEDKYHIDPRRVYVTGMSNGGFMTARMACELADKVAAVGIVSASLSANAAGACAPAKPVSVAIFQGTEDPLVPYRGGEMGKNTAGGAILSHEQTVKKFAQLDHCPEKPQLERIPDNKGDGTTVEITRYSDCSQGTEVRGYTIEGGGHAWPGGVAYFPEAIIGKTSLNLDASETIWEFFAAHSR